MVSVGAKLLAGKEWDLTLLATGWRLIQLVFNIPTALHTWP